MIKILEDQNIFKIIPWEVDLKPKKTNLKIMLLGERKRARN